ncbi:hypothetical protein PR048_011339 [Dryococelus australis]|uniref:Uncharacterized protein n=1 Tax=Dryococelus australis TaxID=614101 RepID=A0ABQ9HML7_9NEOP|nr:hypothetical protein PR048_011339 [Dryococelus australis]
MENKDFHGQLNRWSDNSQCCLIDTQEIFNLDIDDYHCTPKHLTPHADTIGSGLDLDTKPYFDEQNFQHIKMTVNQLHIALTLEKPQIAIYTETSRTIHVEMVEPPLHKTETVLMKMETEKPKDEGNIVLFLHYLSNQQKDM